MNKTSTLLKGGMLLLAIILLPFLAKLLLVPPTLPGNEVSVDSLMAVNDSLIIVNARLDQKMTRMQSGTDSLLQLARQNRQMMDALKTKKNERIHAIDHFDHNELYRFFSRLGTKDTTDPGSIVPQ